MSGYKRIDELEAVVDLHNRITTEQLIAKDGLSGRELSSWLDELQESRDESGASRASLTRFGQRGREVRAGKAQGGIRVRHHCSALREKYKNSRVGIHLFKELRPMGFLKPKKRVKLNDIGSDMQLGMTEPDLMEKYNLSLTELQTVVKQLAAMNYLKFEEVQRLEFVYGGITKATPRRLFPIISLNVYEATNPETQGTLTYLNRDCVGVRGIPANVGAIKTLVLESFAFQEGKPIVFDARCASTTGEGTAADRPVAEFKIVNIAGCILRELQEFASSFTVAFDSENRIAFTEVFGASSAELSH